MTIHSMKYQLSAVYLGTYLYPTEFRRTRMFSLDYQHFGKRSLEFEDFC